MRSWWTSIFATVVATYALDAIATAAGVATVASGLLAAAVQPWLTVLLLASYTAWGWGLRANVGANAALLARTGISTNVLSKAAYDLVGRLSGSPKARRWAAATGYIGTEVLKEAPYYAGAFGAAAITDPITSEEAVIFLIGANVGATLYEYALGRLTEVFLRRRSVGINASGSERLPAPPQSGVVQHDRGGNPADPQLPTDLRR
jgi:hypothetical protein